ncbi:MAG: hypothetical protein V1743_01310 [Nanoarchaeota archaeon]
MKKRILFLFHFLFLTLLLTPFSIGMGLRAPTLKDQLYFSPNLTKDFFYYYATNAGFTQDYEMYVRMLDDSLVDLTPYVTLDHTIDRNVPSGALMPISAHLSLPEKIDIPGFHEIRVGARETQNLGGGMVGVKTASEARITIVVLCPHDCARVSFEAPNGNINESIHFSFSVHNLADHDLPAKGKVEVISPENFVLDVVRTEEKTIKSTAADNLIGILNTTNYKPGEYRAHAVLFWGKENVTEFNATFRIGNKYVKVIEYPKEFVKDAINKMQITVESGWNNPLQGMYAEIFVSDQFGNLLTSFKTISADIGPWQQQTLLGYFDTTGLDYGTYPIKMHLNYENGRTVEEGTIEIKDGALAETVSEVPTELQKPSAFTVSLSTLLIIVIVLLVILIAILLLFLKRKQPAKAFAPVRPPMT